MTEHLRSRPDGWFDWPGDGVDAKVSVRFEQDEVGRHRVVDLRLEGSVTSDLLRAVPIGRIEATADAELGGWRALPTDVIALARARVAELRPKDPHGTWDVPTEPVVMTKRGRAGDAPAVNTRRGRPDEFYLDVAAMYQGLATETHRPAAALADARNVPVSTAHRWIRECRRRGFLPPGRQGRAG